MHFYTCIILYIIYTNSNHFIYLLFSQEHHLFREKYYLQLYKLPIKFCCCVNQNKIIIIILILQQNNKKESLIFKSVN